MAIYYLGCVLNPKLRQPCFIWGTGKHIHVSDMRGAVVARGEYASPGDRPNSLVCEATGYPRVHTPIGTFREGMGFGTALYTALVLGARQETLSPGTLTMNVAGEGVSSVSSLSRSLEGDKWWERALERGVAYSQPIFCQWPPLQVDIYPYHEEEEALGARPLVGYALAQEVGAGYSFPEELPQSLQDLNEDALMLFDLTHASVEVLEHLKRFYRAVGMSEVFQGLMQLREGRRPNACRFDLAAAQREAAQQLNLRAYAALED